MPTTPSPAWTKSEARRQLLHFLLASKCHALQGSHTMQCLTTNSFIPVPSTTPFILHFLWLRNANVFFSNFFRHYSPSVCSYVVFRFYSQQHLVFKITHHFYRRYSCVDESYRKRELFHWVTLFRVFVC